MWTIETWKDQHFQSKATYDEKKNVFINDGSSAGSTTSRFGFSLVSWLLPLGYPHSVREGYLHYQMYDSVQGLSSYLRGVLCHASVLQAVGVGDAEAAVASAALLWIQKDGIGLGGSLLFAGWFSSYFDVYVQEYRLLADLVNDLAMALDMMAAHVPRSWLLPLQAASTLMRTICGMSAGATKASITQYFALESNVADLAAKESTQETVVTLIGMLLGGIMLTKTEINDSEKFTWFVVLTFVHLWANYIGIDALRLDFLNPPRAQALFDVRSIVERSQVVILSPKDLHVPLWKTFLWAFPRRSSWTRSRRVIWGASLADVLSSMDRSFPILSFNDSSVIYAESKRRDVLWIALMDESRSVDELEAYLLAQHWLMTGCLLQVGKLPMSKIWEELQKVGWRTETMHLGFSRIRNIAVCKDE